MKPAALRSQLDELRVDLNNVHTDLQIDRYVVQAAGPRAYQQALRELFGQLNVCRELALKLADLVKERERDAEEELGREMMLVSMDEHLHDLRCRLRQAARFYAWAVQLRPESEQDEAAQRRDVLEVEIAARVLSGLEATPDQLLTAAALGEDDLSRALTLLQNPDRCISTLMEHARSPVELSVFIPSESDMLELCDVPDFAKQFVRITDSADAPPRIGLQDHKS